MKATRLLLTLSALLFSVAAHAEPITYDMVTVGNPGNGTDPASGSVYGRVDYSYQIGKFDVTIGQYTDFLNAVAKTDTYSLYNASMTTNLNVAGISRAGSSGSYTYSVINNGGNSANRPITFVSWFDSARFANWMTNGQGGPGTTETGAYTLNNATSGVAPAKTPGAAFYIPTENEWYKAAFYSPTLNGGTGGYYAFATQNNSLPGITIGSEANLANYNRSPGNKYSVTQSGYDPNQNYLTDVGAFTGSGSFYGTFDQSGNVFQWNDMDSSPGLARGIRGGGWNSQEADLERRFPSTINAVAELDNVGFRLSSPVAVPEPSTYAMALAGLACGGWQMYRRRKQA